MKHALGRGARVPPVVLKQPGGGGEVGLQPVRGPRVIVALHRPDCEECVAYAREVASIRDEVASWGGDIVVVAGASIPDTSVLHGLEVAVLKDPDNIIADGRLSVTIVDEWGEVYFASEPEGTHGRIAAEEVVEWVKFIAIQCPECEGPEGEWRHI
jgi:hypothetical protein